MQNIQNKTILGEARSVQRITLGQAAQGGNIESNATAKIEVPAETVGTASCGSRRISVVAGEIRENP
jgi:hypothetical protein